MPALLRSGSLRINLLGIDAEFGESCLGFLRIEFTVTRQAGKRGCRDRFGVDLKMATQILAIVTTAKAVRAQGLEPAGEPRRKLVRNHLHVVACRNNRAVGALERFKVIWL